MVRRKLAAGGDWNEIAVCLFASVIGLIAWSCAAFGQGTQPADALPKLPVPSGPFGIGRVGYDWADPSRPDQYSSDPKAHRKLMVYFWYPTSEKSADVKGPYLPVLSGWIRSLRFKSR